MASITRFNSSDTESTLPSIAVIIQSLSPGDIHDSRLFLSLFESATSADPTGQTRETLIRAVAEYCVEIKLLHLAKKIFTLLGDESNDVQQKLDEVDRSLTSGKIAYYKGLISPANGEFLHALSLNCEDIDARLWVGHTLLKLDDSNIEEAEDCFKKVLSIDPKNNRALAGVAHVRVLRKQVDQALDLYGHVLNNTDAIVKPLMAACREKMTPFPGNLKYYKTKKNNFKGVINSSTHFIVDVFFALAKIYDHQDGCLLETIGCYSATFDAACARFGMEIDIVEIHKSLGFVQHEFSIEKEALPRAASSPSISSLHRSPSARKYSHVDLDSWNYWWSIALQSLVRRGQLCYIDQRYEEAHRYLSVAFLMNPLCTEALIGLSKIEAKQQYIFELGILTNLIHQAFTSLIKVCKPRNQTMEQWNKKVSDFMESHTEESEEHLEEKKKQLEFAVVWYSSLRSRSPERLKAVIRKLISRTTQSATASKNASETQEPEILTGRFLENVTHPDLSLLDEASSFKQYLEEICQTPYKTMIALRSLSRSTLTPSYQLNQVMIWGEFWRKDQFWTSPNKKKQEAHKGVRHGGSRIRRPLTQSTTSII